MAIAAATVASALQFGVGRAGVEHAAVLLAFPVGVLGLYWLVLRSSRGTMPQQRRRLLFAVRLVVLALLVTGAAVPYTTTDRVTTGDPEVTVLIDESDSMAVYDTDVDGLVEGIEAAGVPASVEVVGRGTESRAGDGIAGAVERDGSVLVVSDGQVTDGRSVAAATELARSVNATISTVDLDRTGTDQHVALFGPEKTTVGVENRFLVRVDGIDAAPDRRVVVTVDGEEVLARSVGNGTVEFTHRFDAVGEHRLTAAIAGEDALAVNDVSRRTVRVVERPRILYVAQDAYPLRGLLADLYDVEVTDSVPSDLSGYTSVVIQDVPANDVGNLDALQRFVIDGGGLVVVGGQNAYEAGGYAESPLASLLPVRVGDDTGTDRTVVIVVDVSGSASAGLRVQQALALDVLDQLGDDTRVGLVAFANDAYPLLDPAPLSESRAEVDETIRRLQSGGGTNMPAGLRTGADMAGEGGTVILLSDGLADFGATELAADELARRDVEVVSVAVGEQINGYLLEKVAERTGGTYLRGNETSRLRLLFGDESRQFRGDRLTIVDSTHFITTGVETNANPSETNRVTVRPGADYLVASGSGRPAVTSWRFGLGRVVSVTAYGADGTLDGLLSAPDSLLVTRSVNWAVGDPERDRQGVTAIPDTRVDEPTTARYVGTERPTVPDVRFVRTGENAYEATIVPSEPGFASLLDAEYAVEYAAEYAAIGQAPELEAAVEATGGQTFTPSDGASVAEFARQQSTRVRTVRNRWSWPFLAAALVVYITEIAIRRLVVRGT